MLLGFLFLCHLPLRADVMPLEVRIEQGKSGILEISKDRNFSHIQSSLKINHQDLYRAEFKENGIYYMRFRSEGKITWTEAFLVVIKGSDRKEIPCLSWAKTPGRYRLSIRNGRGQKQWCETSDQVAFLKNLKTPVIIRLMGVDTKSKTAELPELSLKWARDMSLPEMGNHRPIDTAHGNYEEDSDQTEEEPYDSEYMNEPIDLKAISPSETQVKELPPLLRKSNVSLWMRLISEQFSIHNKDTFDAPTTIGLGTGGEGHLFIRPDLMLSGKIDTHGTHTAFEKDADLAPGADQKRLRSHLSLGLDLLNIENRDQLHSVYIGPAIGLFQLPLVHDNQIVTDLGMKVSLHLYTLGFNFDMILMKSGSFEVSSLYHLNEIAAHLQPIAGIYFCETTQKAGSVNSRFSEVGLNLGLSLEF